MNWHRGYSFGYVEDNYVFERFALATDSTYQYLVTCADQLDLSVQPRPFFIILKISQSDEFQVENPHIRYIDPIDSYYLNCLSVSAQAPGHYVYLLDNISSPKLVFAAVLIETAAGVYEMRRYDMSVVGELGYVNYGMLHNGHLYFVGEAYELLGFDLGSLAS